MAVNQFTTFSTDAVVTVGTIEATDRKGFFSSTGGDAQIFTDYEIRNRYEVDGHRYMMGVTSPTPFQGSSVAFVQLAAQTILWVCDWTAARFNAPPLIPSDKPRNSQLWVLLDEHIEPGMIIVAPDGTSPLYRISGTYFFGCLQPSKVNFSFGVPAWLNLPSSFTRVVPAAAFRQGLID